MQKKWIQSLTTSIPGSLLELQSLKSHPAAAAAAKSLQSCPTLCDPRDGSPPGSPVPGILQARTLEWVAISFFNAWKWKVKVKSLSRVRLFTTPTRGPARLQPTRLLHPWDFPGKSTSPTLDLLNQNINFNKLADELYAQQILRSHGL